MAYLLQFRCITFLTKKKKKKVNRADSQSHSTLKFPMRSVERHYNWLKKIAFTIPINENYTQIKILNHPRKKDLGWKKVDFNDIKQNNLRLPNPNHPPKKKKITLDGLEREKFGESPRGAKRVPGIGERKLKICIRQPSSRLLIGHNEAAAELLLLTLRFHFLLLSSSSSSLIFISISMTAPSPRWFFEGFVMIFLIPTKSKLTSSSPPGWSATDTHDITL